MRIVKKNAPADPGKRTITIRLPAQILDELEKLAEASECSRQDLIEAVLKKALKDDKFSVELG